MFSHQQILRMARVLSQSSTPWPQLRVIANRTDLQNAHGMQQGRTERMTHGATNLSTIIGKSGVPHRQTL